MEQMAHLDVYHTTHPPLVMVGIRETLDIIRTPHYWNCCRYRAGPSLALDCPQTLATHLQS